MNMRMQSKTLAVLAIAVVAALVVSSVPLIDWTVNKDSSDDSFLKGSQWPWFDPFGEPYDDTPGTDSGKVLEPEEPTEGMVEFKEPTTVEELKHLSDLEGKQNFTNVQTMMPPGRNDLAFGGIEEGDDSKSAEREIEEADIVKLVGDFMYVLNPYRGLIIVDVSDPDEPVIIGNAKILGSPVDMYVVWPRAYIVTQTSFNYWYHWAVREAVLMVDVDMAIRPTYRIGSQVTVVDISKLDNPHVMAKVALEGFITDSRRVGDVIYYVSSCYSWYRYYGVDEAKDQTYVMSLNMADPMLIRMVDRISFEGRANQIHVTQEWLYVAQPSYYRWREDTNTNITLVDISDPHGDILVRDIFQVDGIVNDRYQMDHFEETFRVVSHYWRGIGESELWIFDVSDPDVIEQVGRLLIDDAGNLMATRFAGERAYTIHLPRAIDPLDVLDLSDPTDPTLCDVFEMPGWIDHMEVRGMKIIALGVDDSSGTRKVAVSLFDVSDPWNAVMEDRVQIGEGRSWSGANWDPKALTVLDEEGLVLVPFSSYTENSLGYYDYMNGVQLVEFDLDKGDLVLAGWFEQLDAVSRTRSLGDRALATSTNFLQVADLTDHFSPEVTATLELCPVVLDVQEIGGYVMEIIRYHATSGATLRVGTDSDIDIGPYLAELYLGDDVTNWFWNGDYLHVFSKSREDDGTCWAHVSTVDLEDPLVPVIKGSLTYSISDSDYYYYYYYYDYWYPYYYNSPSQQNPLLVDGSLLVYFSRGELSCVDLSNPMVPRLVSTTTLDFTYFLDMRVVDRTVLITNSEYGDNMGKYYYRQYVYYLNRIDFTDPSSPSVLATVNIPGVPLGTDDLGMHIYTTATWWQGDDVGTVSSFNVVRIGETKATIIHAIELDDYSSLVVEDDRAYITTRESVEKIDPVSGETTHQYYTNLIVVELLAPGGPTIVATLWAVGEHYSIRVVDGYVFLTPYNDAGILVYKVTESATLATVGFYMVRSDITTITIEDDIAYLVQGIYGVTPIHLKVA
jgi:hypothetical protein